MNTFAEFRSRKFPPYEGEEDEINPGLRGKRLAEYLIAKLPSQGLSAGESIAEDWGWSVPVEVDGAKLALCCGHQYGHDDTFICFTELQQPVSRKLFRKVDVMSQLTRLVAAVDAILLANRDIGQPTWRGS